MIRLISILAASVVAAGCVSVPPEDRVEHDPWEGLNRGIFKVNEGLDKAIMKPVATGYTKVVPQAARQGVTNFSRNLFTPRSAVANFLQGKPRDGFGELSRFLINSTVGLGGLFDIASRNGIEAKTEDFGQTAAVWGVPDGPYVMLPFLGPTTLRDALVLPFDIAMDPLYHYETASVRDPLYVLRIINLRANLLPLEDMLNDSVDKYVTMRESYLQNRQFDIYDGDPPTDDDDEFFDEFLEEEDY